MGRKESVEEMREMTVTDQVQIVPEKKSCPSELDRAFKSFLQRIIFMLSELDPMVPVMLSLLVMRDSFSFDRQMVVLGSMLALVLIEELV